MRKTTCAILVITILNTFCADDATAQSRRELRRMRKRREAQEQYRQQQEQERQKQEKWWQKEEKDEVLPPRKGVNVVPPQLKTPPQPERDYNYPMSIQKDKYRIDFLAPFYLSELVMDNKVVAKYNLPDKVLPSLKFYEGLSLAADSLKRLGYMFDIYVYDVSDQLESPSTLVNTGALTGSDLIIGMLSSTDFPVIADHVKKHGVNFVSALSPSNYKISSNPYFTMLQPTLETHCEFIEEQIYNKHGNVAPLMFYRTRSAADSVAYMRFTTDNAIEFRSIQCNNIPTKQDLEPLMYAGRTNVILMPVFDTRFAETLLTNLYQWFPDYKFEIWGMPTWSDMDVLKKRGAFPSLTIYYTSPFYFDPTTASGIAVMNAYKNKFGGKADEMVFRGYETMFWYAYLLKKYGTIFNESLWDNGGAPFTRYEIKPVKDEQDNLVHYENKHLYLYRYQGGSYMVER